MKLLSKILNFVVYTTAKFKIDDSHGLSHSLDVLKYSNLIYELEIIKRPYLKDQENIIYIASALHDMCDKKYMNEKEGLDLIQNFLQDNIKSKYVFPILEESEPDTLRVFPILEASEPDTLRVFPILEASEPDTLRVFPILEESEPEKVAIFSQKEIDIILKIIETMSYSKVKKNGFPDLDIYQWAYHIVREADLLAGYNFERAMMYHMYIKNENLENAYIDTKEMFDRRVFNHNTDNLFLTKYGKNKSIKLHKKAINDINQWKKLCLDIT